ncbi:MAG TPA: CVNH domain-containing protein, partial [Candidatus Angelobacter sp.]
LAVAVLALLFGTATPGVAQPGGSYQQTCRNINARGSTLYAECQNTGGGWQSTQLRDYNRCRGEIQNINGSLQCTANNNGGSYGPNDGRGRDDHDRGRDAADRGHDADHDRDRDQYNGAPRGSYYQTCQNVQVNGNTLTASCQKKNGKVKNTSLHNYQQCRDIENDNGKLRCSR